MGPSFRNIFNKWPYQQEWQFATYLTHTMAFGKEIWSDTLSPQIKWCTVNHEHPLSSRLPLDRLIWAYTSKGNFTVWSAYKIALLSSSDSRPENSSNGNHSQFWKNLWRLNVPNKIKSFAWRASRNSLPKKENLCHRKVLDDQIYEACGLDAESSGHDSPIPEL